MQSCIVNNSIFTQLISFLIVFSTLSFLTYPFHSLFCFPFLLLFLPSSPIFSLSPAVICFLSGMPNFLLFIISHLLTSSTFSFILPSHSHPPYLPSINLIIPPPTRSFNLIFLFHLPAPSNYSFFFPSTPLVSPSAPLASLLTILAGLPKA